MVISCGVSCTSSPRFLFSFNRFISSLDCCSMRRCLPIREKTSKALDKYIDLFQGSVDIVFALFTHGRYAILR